MKKIGRIFFSAYLLTVFERVGMRENTGDDTGRFYLLNEAWQRAKEHFDLN